MITSLPNHSTMGMKMPRLKQRAQNENVRKFLEFISPTWQSVARLRELIDLTPLQFRNAADAASRTHGIIIEFWNTRADGGPLVRCVLSGGVKQLDAAYRAAGGEDD